MGCVLEDVTGRCVELTLDRPERLNAVSEELYSELLAKLEAVDDRDDVSAVILKGSGRAFCAGADLKAHQEGTRSERERQIYVELGQQVCRRIQTLGKPIIAAVHGYAIGAGAEIALSADFVVTTLNAVFSFPEVGLGTFVGGGITYRLPRLVGWRRAMDLLILGERFSGREAAAWGLAHRAVEPSNLDAAAHELCERLAATSARAFALMKSAVVDTAALDAAMAFETSALLGMMSTSDWAEGVQAAAQRRAPHFDDIPS